MPNTGAVAAGRHIQHGALEAPLPSSLADLRDVLLRALFHLLVTGTPRVRRPAAPTARIARALQLPLAPDRLRRLHGTVWIAATPHIPTLRGRG